MSGGREPEGIAKVWDAARLLLEILGQSVEVTHDSFHAALRKVAATTHLSAEEMQSVAWLSAQLADTEIAEIEALQRPLSQRLTSLNAIGFYALSSLQPPGTPPPPRPRPTLKIVE
jgi:hypothetical protein